MPHILIVEDDQFLSDAYTAALKKYNFSITMVTDGSEALAAMHKHKPDLVILDLAMPRKNGVEVLREWHREGITQKIPIIVASNLESPDIKNSCLTLGAREYIIKSNITLPDLVALCNRYLSEKKPKKSLSKKPTS